MQTIKVFSVGVDYEEMKANALDQGARHFKEECYAIVERTRVERVALGYNVVQVEGIEFTLAPKSEFK